MRSYDPGKPLIFIHVPKSAGAAVKRCVEDWFPTRFHAHYYNERTGQLPAALPLHLPLYQRKAPVIYGHFNARRGFGVQDRYPEVSQFVTILRDPFDTVISDYFYRRRTAMNWKDPSLIPPAEIEAYFETVTPNILNHFPQPMDMSNFAEVLERLFIEIGVVAHLPESLRRIAAKLHVPFRPETLHRINATPRDQTVPAVWRTHFAERFPLEQAVYDYALARYAPITVPPGPGVAAKDLPDVAPAQPVAGLLSLTRLAAP